MPKGWWSRRLLELLNNSDHGWTPLQDGLLIALVEKGWPVVESPRGITP
jgi:hypothetical protein